jgi:hypothetical protein
VIKTQVLLDALTAAIAESGDADHHRAFLLEDGVGFECLHAPGFQLAIGNDGRVHVEGHPARSDARILGRVIAQLAGQGFDEATYRRLVEGALNDYGNADDPGEWLRGYTLAVLAAAGWDGVTGDRFEADFREAWAERSRD